MIHIVIFSVYTDQRRFPTRESQHTGPPCSDPMHLKFPNQAHPQSKKMLRTSLEATCESRGSKRFHLHVQNSLSLIPSLGLLPLTGSPVRGDCEFCRIIPQQKSSTRPLGATAVQVHVHCPQLRPSSSAIARANQKEEGEGRRPASAWALGVPVEAVNQI